MEKIQDKYNRIRPQLKNGDFILFEGTKPISNIIKVSDKCEKTHIGIIVDVHGSFYIFDSNSEGVKPDRLSFRISQYPKGDFVIKRSLFSQEKIDFEVSKLLRNTDYEIKYDYKNGFKSLVNRLLGTKLKIKIDKYHNICSEFLKVTAINLQIIYRSHAENSLFFPEDYIRYQYRVTTIN